MNNKIVVYLFHPGTLKEKQESKIFKCNTLDIAKNIFEIEKEKIIKNMTAWSYIDITVNGQCLDSFSK